MGRCTITFEDQLTKDGEDAVKVNMEFDPEFDLEHSPEDASPAQSCAMNIMHQFVEEYFDDEDLEEIDDDEDWIGDDE